MSRIERVKTVLAGCALGAETPAENLHAMVKAAKLYG